MKVVVDLLGLKTERDVLLKFGEVFEFGGPDGNIPARGNVHGIGWGCNWDAMNDSLYSLEEGGIWATSKKFSFPLEIEVTNFKEFEENDPRRFQTLKEILDTHINEYQKEGKVMSVTFI